MDVNVLAIMTITAIVSLARLDQFHLGMFPEDINQLAEVLKLAKLKISESRKGGRADECVGLENRCGVTHRGFESHPFHH